MSSGFNELKEIKIGANILSNKIKQLKEYDTKYGTDIVPNMTKNINSVDDIFIKSLSPLSVSGSGADTYLNNEVQSVDKIYQDLINKLSTNKQGCGDYPNEDKVYTKEINTIKKSILGSLNLASKPKKMNQVTMSLKPRNGSKSRHQPKFVETSQFRNEYSEDGNLSADFNNMELKRRKTSKKASSKTGSKSGSKIKKSSKKSKSKRPSLRNLMIVK